MEEQKQEFKHFVRVAQVDLQGEKALSVSLRKIKGVGFSFANAVCQLAKINKQKKTGNLTEDEVSRLNAILASPLEQGVPEWLLNRRKDYESGDDKHIITGTLSYVQENDLKRLKKIKSLRGMRHQRKLPVRGQRTKSNFRRSKGKVIGVAKKKGKKAGK